MIVPDRLASILKLEVPVIVQIADRRMPVEEVINLAPGAIIELPKAADEPLEILINNKCVGLGMAVKVGENFGVRVSYVGNLSERVGALGSSDDPSPAIEEPATDPLEQAGAAA